MMQEINLYQPMFRRERKVFSALTLIQVTAIVVLALIGIYAWQAVSTARLEAHLTALRQRQNVATRKLSALVSRQKRRQVSPALESALADARATLKRQQAALSALSSPAGGNTRGFSKPVAALGHAIVPGLWLTRVDLESGGTQLTLGGRMSRASVLPGYLQALGKQPPFAGRQFSVLHIQRDTKNEPGALAFTLSTAVNPGGGGKP